MAFFVRTKVPGGSEVPEQMPPMNRSPVIILGMHRSGTSCLAGSLQQAGLYLGPVNTKAPHNAKGNRENRDIMDLNDRVLSAAGGSWDNPPDVPVPWSADQIATRDALIAGYPTDKVWGFKEPRTLFTLEGWLNALPNARLVGTFRHPTAVAQSLNARNGFSFERAMDLWLAYNHRLLQFCEYRRIPMVCFDLKPPNYLRTLVDISTRLELTPPPSGFSFFESRLRRNSIMQELKIRTEVRDLYHAMRAMSN